MLRLCASEGDELVRELECFAFLRAVDSQLCFRVRLDADERNRLPETSLRPCAFQSYRFKLLRDVERRHFTALRAGAAAFKSIVGKKLDVRAQSIFTDRTGYSSRPLCDANNRKYAD